VVSIHRIERLNYGIGAAVIVVGAITQPRDIALGLAVGALLTCANFFVLAKLVTRWTRDAAAGRGGNAQLLMLPKMIGLMGAVAVVVLFLPINVIAFIIGYSIFMVSIVAETSFRVCRVLSGEVPPLSVFLLQSIQEVGKLHPDPLDVRAELFGFRVDGLDLDDNMAGLFREITQICLFRVSESEET